MKQGTHKLSHGPSGRKIDYAIPEGETQAEWLMIYGSEKDGEAAAQERINRALAGDSSVFFNSQYRDQLGECSDVDLAANVAEIRAAAAAFRVIPEKGGARGPREPQTASIQKKAKYTADEVAAMFAGIKGVVLEFVEQ